MTEIFGDGFTGQLDNIPGDLHQLRPGDVIRFERHQIIDIMWSEERETPPPPSPPQREYWDRCMVDRCVVDDGVPVYYLYREGPDPDDLDDPEDTYPDSGWRIRGDYRDLSDEELEERKPYYIALGMVLNADDSWLHLIDAPIGSAFIRDDETDEFVPCKE